MMLSPSVLVRTSGFEVRWSLVISSISLMITCEPSTLRLPVLILPISLILPIPLFARLSSPESIKSFTAFSEIFEVESTTLAA